VYRIFPGSATFGRNAVRFMTDIFKEAGVSRSAWWYVLNDLFGKTQTERLSRRAESGQSWVRRGRGDPLPGRRGDLSTR